MEKFTDYLTEKATYTGPVFSDKAGEPQAERHVQKYIHKWTGPNEYNLAKPHEGLAAGTKLKIHSTSVLDGVHHAVVSPIDNEEQKINVPLRKINKPSDVKAVRQKEDTQVSQIHDELERVKKETGSDTVPVMHQGVLRHITHVEQVPGNPKADAILHDKNGNHIYVSLKDGTEPKHYPGLGGVSQKTGLDTSPAVHHFVKRVGELFPGGVSGATPAMELNNSSKDHGNIIRTAMFGTNHAEKQRGIENVDSLLQGNISLKPSEGGKGAFELHAHHVVHNEGPDKVPEGNFSIMARKQTDRHTNIGGTKLPYSRVFIHHTTGRKVSHKIESNEQ